MRREERFMNILGGLDEKYVALAMPSSCGHSTIGDTGNVVYAQPSEDNTEVSKKDLRIYWITRALGMAAALALVVGGGIWMWKNWDKIAVSGNNRPGEVTTVSEPAVTATDIDNTGDEDLPAVTFDEMKNMISYNSTPLSLPCVSDDILALDERLSVKDVNESDNGSFYTFTIDDELICSLTVATSDSDIDIPEGKQLVTFGIRSGGYFSLFGGKIKLGTSLNEVKALLGEPIHNDEYPDYSYTFTSGGESISINDMRFDDEGRLTQMPDISYIGELTVDRFEQITDTSMPEPFLPADTNWGARDFYAQWDRKFGGWNTAVYKSLIDMITEPTERAKYDKEAEELTAETPYTLEDSHNDFSYANIIGLTDNELLEMIEERNKWYNDFGAGMQECVYDDKDISIFVSGDRKKIAEAFASDYSIVVGENVFSPMWLYYHTAEDYKAAGIDPYAMHSLLEKYADLGLTEEAWRAFRKKFILYAYSEMYPEKDRTYTYELDVSEPLGDEAFRIFEDVFYGQWEYAGNIDGHFETFNMTYNGSSFRFGRILGIFETDEIYVIHYSSSGGTLECYVIEKSSPDIMYETDVLTSLGGIEEIKLGDNERVKYINRRAATAELKPGELSIPGLTYLFHIYGSDFEDYYRAIMDRDSYQSISEDEGLYLGNGYVLDNFIQYLADMSENSVTFALPYVHDKQESHQTAVYYELTFTKNESGEWSVEYSKSEAEINTANLTSDEDGELPDYLKYNNLLYRFEKYIDITKIELNNYQLLGQVNEDVFDLPQNDLSSNFLRPGVELYCYSGNEILAVLYYEYVYNDVTRSHDLKILEEPKGILLMEENVYLELYRQ